MLSAECVKVVTLRKAGLSDGGNGSGASTPSTRPPFRLTPGGLGADGPLTDTTDGAEPEACMAVLPSLAIAGGGGPVCALDLD